MPAVESQANRQFVHRIDTDERIVSVNEDWLQFAAENRWPNSAEELCGTPLMRYISGLDVQYIYKLLIERARAHPSPITFNYRCDSPDCRRTLRMTIRHEPKTDTVEFRSWALRLEPRPIVELLDTELDYRASDMLYICSWCKRVQVNQKWLEVEKAVRELGLFADEPLPRMSHGICPQCLQAMITKGASY
jgi:hypothetical protein